MKKIQVTLLVEEAKELIARAVIEHKGLQKSLSEGKVVLKGGTTVSKISEKLTGKPLRICGRITERGTVSSLHKNQYPHTVLLEEKQSKNIDNTVHEEFGKLTEKDTVIIGANALDAWGHVAMMAGSPGGGNIGRSLSFLYAEGVKIIIPVGLEKLIPGNLTEIIKNSSRKGKAFSYGMSVGLLPLYGQVITELEAIRLLADVECQVIGAGGLSGANGSYTLEIWGEDEEVIRILDIIQDIKLVENKISGEAVSLQECQALCESCKSHLSCSYKLSSIPRTRSNNS